MIQKYTLFIYLSRKYKKRGELKEEEEESNNNFG